MKPASEKWKHFERLVAAIHKAADQGAEVRWNEAIHGRQFDVTIRFKKGLYIYLTVIECKDYAGAVPVEKVEAFVTKARDAHAHHAVMASSGGFQNGAQQVAQRHNITLIHVTDSTEIDVSVFGAVWGPTVDALHVDHVELQYNDGERRPLPTEANAMEYYVNHISLRKGEKVVTLHELITRRVQSLAGSETDAYGEHAIDCPDGYVVEGPDDDEFPSKPIACIHLSVAMTTAKTISGPIRVDPSFLIPDVKVQNLTTGAVDTISRGELPMGTCTEFKIGEFYEQLNHPNYFYCDRFDGDSATIYVVESFQHGQLFQAELTVPARAAPYYSPVTDEAVLKRLRKRLARMKARRP